jgi:hypothetical protein
MSDTDDAHAPIEITDIEIRDVASIANRRKNNDREVANDDADYREITERRENQESMYAKEDDAAHALLRLSRKPRKVKTVKTIKKTIETKQRPLVRGKTKKKRKRKPRKKGKSHKKKKISRRGKK